MGNSKSVGASYGIEDSCFNKEELKGLYNFYKSFHQDGKVSKDLFTNLVSSSTYPSFGGIVYNHIFKSGADTSFQCFHAFASSIIRTSPTNTLQLLWRLIEVPAAPSSPSPSPSPQEADKVSEKVLLYIKVILEFAECTSENIESLGSRMTQHILSSCNYGKGKQKETTEDVFNAIINWSNKYAPRLSQVVSFHFVKKFFESIDISTSRIAYNHPELVGGSSIVSSDEVVPLSLYTAGLEGTWAKLYTTDTDGLSFNRIAFHILGYSGPSCLLIKCVGNDIVFGAYNEYVWKESNRFFGSSESFLFRLAPSLQIFPAKDNTNNAFQWLNLKSYGLPHGLGMGGTTERFRFYISDTLEDCYANATCDTFESGVILQQGNASFVIETMEIWGCGGTERVRAALGDQAKDREIRDSNIQKARQVDKAQFVNNRFDQEYLLPKNFSHKVRMAEDVRDDTGADNKS